jgi:hypothetical protein
MVLFIEIGDKQYKLRAANYYKLEYLSFGWTPPENFQPCTDLPKRARIRVEFAPTPGQEYFGILHAIEIHR